MKVLLELAETALGQHGHFSQDGLGIPSACARRKQHALQAFTLCFPGAVIPGHQKAEYGSWATTSKEGNKNNKVRAPVKVALWALKLDIPAPVLTSVTAF